MLSSRNINFDGIYDIDNCRFLDEQTFIIEDQRTQLKVGDILFTSVGTIGRSCVVKEYIPICFQRSVSVLTTLVLNQYLKMVLDSPYYQTFFIKHATGTAQKGFYLNQMSKLIIPIPPLNEQYRIYNKYINKYQKRICEYNDLKTKLEKLDRNINHTLKKSILQYAIQGKLVEQNPNDEPASELIKRIRLEKEKLIKSGKLKKDKNESYIYRGSDNSYYEKFQNGKEVCIDDEIPFEIPDNWIWIRLESICTYIFSGKSPKYSKIVNNNLVLGQKNNQDYGIDLSGIKYCTNEFIENYPKEFYLRKNDVLLNTLGGGTVGRSGIFSLEDNKYITDGHLFVFRSINDIISHYLLYYLKLNREAMEKSADGSTNQTFLKLNSVKKYLIPCPPFQEQARIVSTVRKLFNLL